MNKSKNKKGLIIMTIMTFLLMVVGATYAFFQSQNDSEVSTDVNIETKTTDSLSFENGDSINIHIDATSFTEGGDNVTGSTNVKAKLQASNIDYEATEKYYLYLKIDENGFTYTTNDLKPELILEITDPGGQPVTKVTGLDYVTSNGISGFDITAKKGTIPIALDYTIEATGDDTEIESKKGTKEQTWQFKITFINLNSDQQVNAGKSLVASALITHDKQEDIYTNAYHTTCKDNTLACHIAKTYGSDDNLVYHDSNLYLGANDLSYRFTGGGYKLTDKDPSAQSVYDILKMTRAGQVLENNYNYDQNSYFYFTYEDSNHLENLKSSYEKGINDGYMIKDEINNYVCFGSIAPCPENNLYQVIGLFKNNEEYQVKLIKADYASKSDLGENGCYVNEESITSHKNYLGNLSSISVYHYHLISGDNGVVYWNQSDLNTKNLNQKFLSTFESTWQDKIALNDWQEGGMSTQYGIASNAKISYEYELGGKAVPKTTSNKIGLMYVSDYYYAAEPKYWYLAGASGGAWDTSINNMDDYRSTIFDNWLYKGNAEWFLTPILNLNGEVYRIYHSGFVVTANGNTGWPQAVRPVFYLNSNVNYVSGTGTSEDPIILG